MRVEARVRALRSRARTLASTLIATLHVPARPAAPAPPAPSEPPPFPAPPTLNAGMVAR